MGLIATIINFYPKKTKTWNRVVVAKSRISNNGRSIALMQKKKC